jgi:hypothetical protein
MQYIHYNITVTEQVGISVRLEKFSVQISAGAAGIRSFPQSLQEHVGILPGLGHDRFLPTVRCNLVDSVVNQPTKKNTIC